MLIRLFCRVKTLLITTSNYIVEIRLQTIEIKKTHWFSYFNSPKKRILTSARDFPRPSARPLPHLFSWLSLQVLIMILESFKL